MFSLLFNTASDTLIADLWEAGTIGIQEAGNSLRAFFEAGAPALMERFAPYHPELRYEDPRDWSRAWQDQWEPILAGRRFYLVPEWRDDPTPPGRLRLAMRPGQACGTGAHPATQLSLEALESHLRPGATVLDIGTGSGILAEAALMLGAARVAACDIDPIAVWQVHDLPCPQGSFLLFRGSARSIRSRSIDLVVANINAAAITALMPEIKRVLKPAGKAILAGFTERDRGRLEKAWGGHPACEPILSQAGSPPQWIALIFEL